MIDWTFRRRPSGGWDVFAYGGRLGHVERPGGVLWHAYDADGRVLRTAIRTRDEAARVVVIGR